MEIGYPNIKLFLPQIDTNIPSMHIKKGEIWWTFKPVEKFVK